MTYKAKAAQYKKDETESLVKLMQEYPVIGVVNVENLPAKQLQVLRKKVRKDVLIRMSKKEFITRAIKLIEGREGFENLAEHCVGMPALMFTQQNPFKVSSLIRKSKSKAAAKPGQIAPYDLIIPAGPTQFTPGPIISELGAVGLKTGVENGKITIKEDKVVAQKGAVLKKEVVDLLAKFNIEPMEIGLDLVAAYEQGLIYGREVLSIDPAQYLERINLAAAQALSLSVEVGFPTKDNISKLIATAYKSARHIAIEHKIMSDALLEKEIGEAYMAAKSISDAANLEN